MPNNPDSIFARSVAEHRKPLDEAFGIFDPTNAEPRFKPPLVQRGTLGWHARISDLREALKTAEVLAVELGIFEFDEELRDLHRRLNEWAA